MTEFKDAVEKRRGLIALDKWSKQIKHIHYNNGIEEVTFRDGSKELTDIITEEVTHIPRKERRRELIDSKPFQWFLDINLKRNKDFSFNKKTQKRRRVFFAKKIQTLNVRDN